MDGRVEILPVRSITDLRGIAKSPRKKPVSLKEMDDAVGEGIVERFKRATRK
jgi:hypothetical protein